MKSVLVCTCLFLLLADKPALAQLPESGPAMQRTESILAALNMTDTSKTSSVKLILVSYFDTLEEIFRERNAVMATAKDLATQEKELAEARSKAAWDAAAGKLNKLHATFLGKLSSVLTAAQVEVIKDVMTENGLHDEYQRFLELLPDLTEQQKAQVRTYLQEARENAMDAETTDMRKQWFIKYRGRANNFLAAAGYDLRKATVDLERLKAGKENTQTIK